MSIQKPSTLCGVYTGHPCSFKNHLPCVVYLQIIPVHSKTMCFFFLQAIPVLSKTIYLVWCVYRLSLYVQKTSTLCGVCTGRPCPIKNHLPCVVCIQIIPVCSKTIYLVWCVYRSSLCVRKPSTLCDVYTGHTCLSKTTYLVWCVVVYISHLYPFKKIYLVWCVHRSSLSLCKPLGLQEFADGTQRRPADACVGEDTSQGTAIFLKAYACKRVENGLTYKQTVRRYLINNFKCCLCKYV